MLTFGYSVGPQWAGDRSQGGGVLLWIADPLEFPATVNHQNIAFCFHLTVAESHWTGFLGKKGIFVYEVHKNISIALQGSIILLSTLFYLWPWPVLQESKPPWFLLVINWSWECFNNHSLSEALFEYSISFAYCALSQWHIYPDTQYCERQIQMFPLGHTQK